jgi:nitrogen fixation/metabolism regulation signal transduction histidine kinase
MLAILALAFLVTGIVAIYSDIEQNKAFKQEALERKEKSVRASLDYFLIHEGGHMSPDSVAYKFADKICELADVHQMFIGLFDLRGEYLISNNSAYLDSLQIPAIVPQPILKSIQNGYDKKLLFEEYQHEGYTLAYWLFSDIDGHPIAIIAMDYSNADEESKDVKDFLLGVSGSYLILFFVAAVIAFILSRYITRSLRTIAQRMKSTDLSQNFEPLHWEYQDEIGNLVVEYNKMLTVLKISADQLAEKEREGAWREMAQQIAHDIKNPLTPMRLRVQHLKRQFDNEDKAQFQSHLLVFIQTMTEQIDALANIANTFSQLARTETLEMEKISPEIFFLSLTTFYKDEDCSIDVFVSNPNVSISANHNALHRIATNLITNAIQAKKDGVNMHIDIKIGQHFGKVFVVIQDNGQGIPESMMGQLFQPKFTTKKTGSGLGLATAKALMEKMNGQIFCKSKEQIGTRFYLVFPTVAVE